MSPVSLFKVYWGAFKSMSMQTNAIYLGPFVWGAEEISETG